MDIQREVQVLVVSVVYALVGLALLFSAYKIFDAFTPTRMEDAIFREGNVAVAITVGAFIIGIALILSAALR